MNDGDFLLFQKQLTLSFCLKKLVLKGHSLYEYIWYTYTFCFSFVIIFEEVLNFMFLNNRFHLYILYFLVLKITVSFLCF